MIISKTTCILLKTLMICQNIYDTHCCIQQAEHKYDNVVTASVPCDCKSLSHKFDHPSRRRHLKDVGKAHLVLFHHGLQTAKSTKGWHHTRTSEMQLANEINWTYAWRCSIRLVFTGKFQNTDSWKLESRIVWTLHWHVSHFIWFCRENPAKPPEKPHLN